MDLRYPDVKYRMIGFREDMFSHRCFDWCFRSVMGMATVGNMMSQVMKSKAKVTDPVSTVVYKQFKQARVLSF